MARLILLISLISPSVFAGGETEAIQKTTEAAYKQLGIDLMLTNVVKQIIPEQHIYTLEKLSPIVFSIINRRLDITWTF